MRLTNVFTLQGSFTLHFKYMLMDGFNSQYMSFGK